MHLRIILGSIGPFGGEVVDFDTFINVAGSSVTFVRVAEEAGTLKVDGFNISISFDLVTVRSWIIFREFSHKEWSTFNLLLFNGIRVLGVVYLLFGETRRYGSCLSKMATFLIKLKSVGARVKIELLDAVSQHIS
jgi:hypothetical protein